MENKYIKTIINNQGLEIEKYELIPTWRKYLWLFLGSFVISFALGFLAGILI